MEQTAVQWLMHQMLEASMDTQTGEMHIKLPKDAFQQAKAMEKEQIERAYKRGQKHKKPLKDSNPINKYLKSE